MDGSEVNLGEVVAAQGTEIAKSHANLVVRCGKEKPTGGPCRREAGWGTHHRGDGYCIDHDDGYLEPQGEFSASYADIITDDKFRRLVLKYEKSSNLMSLNGELALCKAMLAYMGVDFAKAIDIDADTGAISVAGEAAEINDLSRDMLKAVREIANIQKVMASVESMAREYVPREQVRRYVSAMSAILQRRLRNICPECGGELNILDDVMADMEDLQKNGGLG